MAKEHPDINYIAIDVVPDVLVIALEKATAQEVENVRFIIADAMKLCEYFEYDEVKQIYLNFSDPWKKNKQAKRRLTHKNFLDIYKKLLKEGNLICFKTDNKALFEFSLNSFTQENFKLQNITLDLHNSKFEGNVIGINTIKLSNTEVEGIGFAIAISEAKPIIADLMNNGYVSGRPLVGIIVTENKNGLSVSSILEDSGAQNAGIQVGDLIVKADGAAINTSKKLNEIRDKKAPGESIVFTVIRNGELSDIEVILGEDIPSR